jgi:hypothetical protein
MGTGQAGAEKERKKRNRKKVGEGVKVSLRRVQVRSTSCKKYASDARRELPRQEAETGAMNLKNTHSTRRN